MDLTGLFGSSEIVVDIKMLINLLNCTLVNIVARMKIRKHGKKF